MVVAAGSPVRCMHAPAKVCNLQLATKAHQQVLRFDVPVDDVLGVTVVQGTGEAQHVTQQVADALLNFRDI